MLQGLAILQSQSRGAERLLLPGGGLQHAQCVGQGRAHHSQLHRLCESGGVEESIELAVMATRILLLTQWFDPEPTFKGLVFARELVSQGFEVEVLTGLPSQLPRG